MKGGEAGSGTGGAAGRHTAGAWVMHVCTWSALQTDRSDHHLLLRTVSRIASSCRASCIIFSSSSSITDHGCQSSATCNVFKQLVVNYNIGHVRYCCLLTPRWEHRQAGWCWWIDERSSAANLVALNILIILPCSRTLDQHMVTGSV